MKFSRLLKIEEIRGMKFSRLRRKIVVLMECMFVKMGKFAKVILANKITGGS